MARKLIQAIVDKLFVPGGKSLVVAINRDEKLLSDGMRSAIESECGIKVFSGNSLDLRLLREKRLAEDDECRTLFAASESIDILEDILQECEVVTFQMKSFFQRYPWDRVKSMPADKLCWLYEQPRYVYLVNDDEDRTIEEGEVTEETPEIKFKISRLSWSFNMEKLDFNRPTEWMNRASEILLGVIEQERWGEFQDEVKAVNDRFNDFLKKSYVNIVSSACSPKYPRIVTQILPFINRQNLDRVALVVVDGMNYWQAKLLTKSLESNLGVSAGYDCIYSWLPSVTELSRQAIFRGEVPSAEYVQSPQNEAKLWKEFWGARSVAPFEQYYQHSGVIREENSVKKLAYVTVDLDEKMHASEDYMYLYDNTRRWVKDEEFLGNIKHLIDRGYKVYITTDHGNIETTGFRRLDSRDKLGADVSNRHIIIPDSADKGIFEAQYEGHLCQVDALSRTYYAVGKEAFCSEPKCVTHGGTHWLEVLIPFITLN